MKIWIRTAGFLLCLAMALLLFACGGENPAVTTENHSEPEEGISESSSSDIASSESESQADTESKSLSDTETESETETKAPGYDTVEEKDGVVTVKTPVGFTYSVTNYKSFEGIVFTFDDGLEITVPESISASSFNRFTMEYQSNEPLHILITYRNAGAECVDDFYLEAGKGSFSGLITDYIAGSKGRAVSKIVIDTCREAEAEFALYSFGVERIPYYAELEEPTYYIQNDRYKLGVDLNWGGSLTYLEDFKDGVAELTNLVNRHDVGRLIQQSYYGTPAIPGVYEPGRFDDADWVYNPVQGGDHYNNCSRLIDIVVTEKSIYIKAQPQDWSMDGAITPSYMENTYTIEEDYVRVDNRFVDFSSYEHPVTGQELPAFYTVSYLDTFVCYNGQESWTDDELIVRDDLPYWGNAGGIVDGRYTYRKSNTETWSAFVNKDTNYGFGLFVPAADTLKAGRYKYDDPANGGTMDGDANPCSYIAPGKRIRLVNFEALEYSYLLTTGSVEEIRATFKANKDFTDNAYLRDNGQNNRLPDVMADMTSIDFTKEGNTELLLSPFATEISYDETFGAAKLTVTDHDPSVYFDFALSSELLYTDNYIAVEIEYMIPTAGDTRPAELFVCAGNTVSATGGKSVGATMIADGAYHKVTFNLNGKDFWSGKINKFRFDYFNGAVEAGEVMYIKSFKLVEGKVETLGQPDVEHPSYLDFTFKGNATLLKDPKDTDVGYDENLGAARLRSTVGVDSFVYIKYKDFEEKISTAEYTTLKVTYMVPASNSRDSYKWDLYICANGENPADDMRVNTALICDGEFHTFEVDLSQYDYWMGDLDMIRFDYFASCAEGDCIYIKSFELTK